MKKLFVHYVNTFCWSCLVDLEKIKKLDFFENMELEICKDIAVADYIYIYTCGVDGNYKEKAIEEIKAIYKKYCNKKIIVLGGCLIKIEKKLVEELQLENGTTVLMDNSKNVGIAEDKTGVVTNEMLSRTKGYKISMSMWSFGMGNLKFLNRIGLNNKGLNTLLRFSYCYAKDLYAVRVSRGCLNNCAYCADRTARGKMESRSAIHIVNDIKKGLEKGYRNIALASDDLSAYGQDINSSFEELMDMILELDDNFSLYLENVNPRWLIPALENRPNILKDKRITYLCLPIQHVNNEILDSMRREYKIEDVDKLIEKIKLQNPSIVINTHLMIGFPGETVETADQMKNWIKKTPIDIAEIFLFNAQPNTDAYTMKKSISDEQAKELNLSVRKVVKKKVLRGFRLTWRRKQ